MLFCLSNMLQVEAAAAVVLLLLLLVVVVVVVVIQMTLTSNVSPL